MACLQDEELDSTTLVLKGSDIEVDKVHQGDQGVPPLFLRNSFGTSGSWSQSKRNGRGGQSKLSTITRHMAVADADPYLLAPAGSWNNNNC